MLCCKQPPADAQRRLLLYEHNMGRYDDQRWLKILMLDYYTYSIHRRQGLSLLCSSSMRMENGNNTALVLTAKHISSTWIDSFNRDHSDLCCSAQCSHARLFFVNHECVFLGDRGEVDLVGRSGRSNSFFSKRRRETNDFFIAIPTRQVRSIHRQRISAMSSPR